jgi:hypothetical protein
LTLFLLFFSHTFIHSFSSVFDSSRIGGVTFVLLVLLLFTLSSVDEIEMDRLRFFVEFNFLFNLRLFVFLLFDIFSDIIGSSSSLCLIALACFFYLIFVSSRQKRKKKRTPVE